MNENNLSSSEEDICQAVEDQEVQLQEQPEVEQIEESVVVDEHQAVEEQVAVDEEVVVVVEQQDDKSEPVVESIETEVEEVQQKTIEEEPRQSIEVEDKPVVDEYEAVVDIAQDLETSDVATAAPSVTKPRRRRGKRSGQQNSEKQQRSAQLREENKERNNSTENMMSENRLNCPTIKIENADNNIDSSKKLSEKKSTDDQWESLPADLKTATTLEQWETSTRTRRSRKGVRPQQRLVQTEETEEDVEEEQPKVVKREVTPPPPVETPVVSAPLVEEVIESEAAEECDTERSSSAPETRSSSSAPSSRRSTLKKQNRKKRPSLDDGKSDKSSVSVSSVRPVLIQDGLIDITAGGILSCRNVIKRPTDLLDEQALMIKDIGHGMREGPINMGRFGIGKYIPPDRSDEILSSIVARQIKDEEQNEEEEKEATTATDAAKASVAINGDSHCQDLDLD